MTIKITYPFSKHHHYLTYLNYLYLLLLGFLCSPSLQANPDIMLIPIAPTSTQLSDTHFIASDQVALRLTRWPVKAGQVKQANLILLHGFNEYAAAFDDVGQYFSSQGIEVWAYDQRGFGDSEQRGLWFGHQKMAQDLREFARLIKDKEPDVPLYSSGMSMGGAVTLVAAQQGQLAVDGLILVAPAVWARRHQPFYQRWALAVTRRLFPSWQPSQSGVKRQATDNIEMLRRVWSLPYMIRKNRMDTVAGLVDLMDAALVAGKHNTLPVLLLYGDKDQLVPLQPTLELWQGLKKQNRDQFKRYPNGWHMLMRDLNGQAVMDDIIKWIE